MGPGGRLAQLPRAVAERRLRAVLRGAVRRAARPRAWTCRVRRHDAADAQVGDRRVRPGARSTSATGSVTSRATAASSARSSTTRARSSCTCCGGSSATRRSSGAAPLLPRVAFQQASAPTTSGRRWRRESGRPLERFFERWIYGSTLPRLIVQLPRRRRRDGRAPRRAGGRALRRAGDRDAAIRRPHVGRRHRAGQRAQRRPSVPLAGALRAADISRTTCPLASIVKRET